MKTKFCSALVEVGAGRHLFMDGNSKITASNGTFDEPKPNAFSLIQVQDCPGSTPTCRAECYVHRLEEHEPAIHALYEHNSRTLREIIDAGVAAQASCAAALALWIKGNISGNEFRWHVSGDLINMAHAFVVTSVVRATPETTHWIYTRSFSLVPALYGLTNMIVNISADRDNYAEAAKLHKRYGFRICYMTVDGTVPDNLPGESVIFPSHGLRGRDMPEPKEAPFWQSLGQRERKMVCPPDFFGQSEKLRCGPCRRCMV